MRHAAAGWFVLLALALLLLPGNALRVGGQEGSKKKEKVTGKIEFKGDAQFDKETVAVVKIQDVSLADAAAKTVAEHTIKGLKKFPIEFEVEYDPAIIQKGHSYAVSVRIETRGKLEYTNDTSVPVISNGTTKDVTVPVIRVKKT